MPKKRFNTISSYQFSNSSVPQSIDTTIKNLLLNSDSNSASVPKKHTHPTLEKGGKPFGKYENVVDRGTKKQNETADILAAAGYHIIMLSEINDSKGNGYGLKEGTNPDYIIEGNPFDCYSPKPDTNINNICRTIKIKTKRQATRIVLNLDDFPDDQLEALYNAILKKTEENADLRRLEELIIVRNNKIIKLYER